MSKRHIIAVTILATGLAAVAGTTVGRDYWRVQTDKSGSRSSPLPTSKANQPIRLASTDLGEVWESTAARVQVRIQNLTHHPVRVLRLTAGCGCVRFDPATVTIPPGEVTSVNLLLDLSDRGPPEFGLLNRRFEFSLTAEVEGFGLCKPCQMSGVCRSHLATSLPVFHFGESNVFGRPPVSRMLVVTHDQDTADVALSVDSPSFKIGLPKREKGKVHVALSPNTDSVAGPFEANVRVQAVNRDGQVIGTTMVFVDGVVRQASALEGNGHAR